MRPHQVHLTTPARKDITCQLANPNTNNTSLHPPRRGKTHTHLPAVAPQPRNNIAALLADKAHNNDTALIVPSAAGGVTHISYRELAQAAARVQDYLQSIGVREGDRVALSLPNVPLMPAIYYGVLAAGAICVPLNPLLSAAELEHHIQDSTAKSSSPGRAQG